MTGEVFIDTNLLVYAYDHTAGEKHVKANEILDVLLHTGRGVLSAQVLAEFFRVSTSKLSPPLTKREAYNRVANLIRAWKVLNVTDLIVLEAARAAAEYDLAYWDAQIWATAKLNQVPVIFTEDVPAPSIEGIRYVNPFAAEFHVKEWVW
ncbi:MAG TPA: PIN domain-containing protein [Candidatus Acetothermia bacterium]|nr:PIN domain-containing protein [Candidatus Acetothermia bacterium]